MNMFDIEKLVEQMDEESRDIRKEALRLTWYMRGGLTYEQAFQLSTDERKIISEIVKDNMDTTKKSGLPFF